MTVRKMMNSGIPMRKAIAMGAHDRMYGKPSGARPKPKPGKPMPKPKGGKGY